jgi:hypothetical protein
MRQKSRTTDVSSEEIVKNKRGDADQRAPSKQVLFCPPPIDLPRRSCLRHAPAPFHRTKTNSTRPQLQRSASATLIGSATNCRTLLGLNMLGDPPLTGSAASIADPVR